MKRLVSSAYYLTVLKGNPLPISLKYISILYGLSVPQQTFVPVIKRQNIWALPTRIFSSSLH